MSMCTLFFFFNDTATTEIYTLSLHDALPISGGRRIVESVRDALDLDDDDVAVSWRALAAHGKDRKSTRLNSSHLVISYAVFCLIQKLSCYNLQSQSLRSPYR